jgi:hypothetical protein
MKYFLNRNRALLTFGAVILLIWAIEKIFGLDLISNRGVLLGYATALYLDIRDRIDDLERSLYE